MKVTHQYDTTTGAHRIIVVDDKGKQTEGRWAGYKTLAQHKGYYAAGNYFEGVLPVGIFRLNVVPHEVDDHGQADPATLSRQVGGS